MQFTKPNRQIQCRGVPSLFLSISSSSSITSFDSFSFLKISSKSFSEADTGCILAEEMGLGKTVQVIALICASLELGEEDDYDPKPTLLVIPKSLLPMWMEQLKIWANKLSITRYHGSHRKKSVNQRLFARTHITVTTYGEVRSEYKYYKAVNLVFQAQANHNGDLRSMPKLPSENSRILPLMTTQWHRVILEEPHISRNTSKQTFKAVHFLETQKRWAITGTPFMNDYTDIKSLLKFLREEEHKLYTMTKAF